MRDERADRHHAGAADAGDQQVEGAGPGPGRGLADGAQLARHVAALNWRPSAASQAGRRSTVTKLGQKPFTQE
jgi:hypothetical protein